MHLSNDIGNRNWISTYTVLGITYLENRSMADFIISQKRLHPDQAEEYDHFSSLYSQKYCVISSYVARQIKIKLICIRLWHQLSLALEEFLMIKSNLRDGNFAEVLL